MKILQATKYHYRRAGAESVFFNTMDLLNSHGHQTVPFTIRHPLNIPSKYDKFFAYAPEIRDMGTLDRVKSIPRFFVNKDAVRKLDELLEQEKPDIAHLHNIFNGLSLSILPVFAKHKVPVVITVHDPRFICPSAYFNLKGKKCDDCKKGLYTNCMAQNCMDSRAISIMSSLEMIHKEFFFNYDKYISRYIFLNQNYMDMFAQRHEYFRKKGDILFNFIPMPPKAEAKRGDYMLFFGRMTPEKGILTLLRAAEKNPDVKFKFAGRGIMEDVVRQSGLPNVEALGFVSGQPLEDLVRNASFILVPSEWMENNPMSVIEANGYGKPTISAAIGGVPEIVINGKTGFLFTPGDVDELSASIRHATDMSNKEYENMSDDTYQFAVDNFSPEAHYKRLMKIYEKAINLKQ